MKKAGGHKDTKTRRRVSARNLEILFTAFDIKFRRHKTHYADLRKGKFRDWLLDPKTTLCVFVAGCSWCLGVSL